MLPNGLKYELAGLKASHLSDRLCVLVNVPTFSFSAIHPLTYIFCYSWLRLHISLEIAEPNNRITAQTLSLLKIIITFKQGTF